LANASQSLLLLLLLLTLLPPYDGTGNPAMRNFT
jgi:hypothetical protein